MTSTYPETRPFELNPKQLRRLLSERDGFSTSMAMEILRLREPDATLKLIEIARAGWIEYDGERNRMDRWKPAQSGINFSMKKMMKRAGVAEGRTILELAIEAARTFNAKNRSTAITRIALFGSLVRGGDERGTIGDIDLQISYERRRSLSDDQYKARLAVDQVGAPAGGHYGYATDWARSRGLRSIRAVSTRISASSWDNIGDMGCDHQIVYEYDSAESREVSVDGRVVPADEVKQAAFNVTPETGDLPTPPQSREMPPFQTRTETYARVDGESAEYGWVRGMSIAKIALWLGNGADEVRDTLAARGMDLPEPGDVILMASPLETLEHFMAAHPGHHFEVRMGSGSKGGETNVSTTQGRRRGHATATASGVERTGDARLSAICTVVAEAGEVWYARIRKSMPRATLGIMFDFISGQSPRRGQPGRIGGTAALARKFNARFKELYATTPCDEQTPGYRLKRGHLRLRMVPNQRLEYLKQREWEHGTTIDDHDLVAMALPIIADICGDRATSFAEVVIDRRESKWVD